MMYKSSQNWDMIRNVQYLSRIMELHHSCIFLHKRSGTIC